ncbi:MAG: hypothetical protein ACOX9E_12545 [Lentisphaeria bacterium]|jgi:hypothetical protein
MKIPTDISIIDLLRQRESEFVKVWSCEEGIRRLLGMVDYPFPAPPPLPSLRKSKNRKASRQLPVAQDDVTAAFGDAPAKTPLTLRALQAPTENAYRIVFRRGNVVDSSFQNDPELIKILHGLNLADFALLSVETVSFTSLSNWCIVAELWKNSEETLKEEQQA